MKLITLLGGILAARAMALLTLLSLALLTGGIALKADPATAAIVAGTIVLIDLELTAFTKRAPK